MADKVLGVCPPTAKSDGNDFVSLINLAHALPDELINSSDLGLPNGMDQLHTILGGGGMSVPLGCSAQDTAAKHKHFSVLLHPGGPPSTSTVTSGPGNVPSLEMMGGLGGSTVTQGLGGPQQQSGMMMPLPDFVSLFDLEHDLPDELINSSDLGLPNGMDQLHTILGGGGMSVPLGCSAQDTAAKHKHLSELLRPGGPPSTSTVTSGPGNVPSLGMMGGLGGSTVAQGLGGPQQQSGMMPQPGMGCTSVRTKAQVQSASEDLGCE